MAISYQEVLSLPVKATLVVIDKQKVTARTNFGQNTKDIGKTRDITGGLPRVAELFEARKANKSCCN